MATRDEAVSARDSVRKKFDKDTGISSTGVGVVRIGEGKFGEGEYGMKIYLPPGSSNGLLPTAILGFPIRYTNISEAPETKPGLGRK